MPKSQATPDPDTRPDRWLPEEVATTVVTMIDGVRKSSAEQFNEALQSRPFLMREGTRARVQALETLDSVLRLRAAATPGEKLSVVDSVYRLSNSNLTEWLDSGYSPIFKNQLSDLISTTLKLI